MQDLDKTISYSRVVSQTAGTTVTVFDGRKQPYTISLNSQKKDVLYFGRDPKNDIVLNSHLVSGQHGRFVFRGNGWFVEDKAVYTQKGSTNGLIYNNMRIYQKGLSEGDFIRIDDGFETVIDGVLFVFSTEESGNQWKSVSLFKKNVLTIGRSSSCDIVLPHVSVSKAHARIVLDRGEYYIIDNGSVNGVFVNGIRIPGRVRLHEKDVITITTSKIIFTPAVVSYCCFKSGISVDASDIVIKRGKGSKAFITCNHVSLNIRPGELVAIIGGSGAGKSTILNCMCGYLKPDQGEVLINGISLYQNFDSLKKIVGYVPQSDIVYDNLTLHDMLMYTAKLRLPEDTSPQEREAAIERAIAMVELQEKKDSMIKALSGGQRKRASIAVELLSDPNLLFLDEPASGLDPGTERNLMVSLRKMADGGKTVILVTHSTLQLKMCDKIVFMGKGGNLCFYGSYNEALRFFGVSDVIDVYNMITEQPERWRAAFERYRVYPAQMRKVQSNKGKGKTNQLRQLGVLIMRYLKLVANDKQRLLLLLFQAPLLALLISFVADDNQFEQYEMTKSLLFALSCSAFWVGMLNAIQEICKERTILKREYMTGLSLNSYVYSKLIVLGILCFIQSIMITFVFGITVGMPDYGVMTEPYIEVFITTFITAVSSAAMGLFVSSLFTNADRAMTVAPILLMPQMLFSGMLFKLSGATEAISWFAICRWSMEGFGTIADINELPLRLQQEGIPIEHEAESFYDFTASHLLLTWGIMILFTFIFLTLARLVLSKIGKEKS